HLLGRLGDADAQPRGLPPARRAARPRALALLPRALARPPVVLLIVERAGRDVVPVHLARLVGLELDLDGPLLAVADDGQLCRVARVGLTDELADPLGRNVRLAVELDDD